MADDDVLEHQQRLGRQLLAALARALGGHGGEPWCMALMQTGIAYAETKTGRVSPIVASELCSYVWSETPKIFRVKKVPASGALAIWGDLDLKGRIKATGHVEMVESFHGDWFSAVGGNTSGSDKPGGEVTSNGNACVYTRRSVKATAKRKLLGFLKPF